MSTYSQDQVNEHYQRLPDVLKQAIYSADIAEKMFELGKKHGLTLEKTGFMSEEAGYVVLGLTPPRAFTSALAERLGIAADAAEKIALEISHEIFFPLREALKQTHQIEVGERAMMKNEGIGMREEGLGQEKLAPPMPQAVKNASTVPSPMPQPQSTPIPVSPPPPAPKPRISTSATASGGNDGTAEVVLRGKPILPSPTILSAEVKPPPMPPVPSKTEAPKTPESPKTEVPKKMPPALRAVADDLEKEIAPLIGGIHDDRPHGFLSQEEIARMIAERQKEQAGVKKHELGIRDEQKTPVSPIPPAPRNSIDLRASAPPPPPPPPPAVPINPKIPPIDLRAVPPKEQSGTPPPARAPEKIKPYQGYDPYREPIE